MQGVNTKVLGIDDEGNSIMMNPGREYQFPGNDVYEIPIDNLREQLNPTRPASMPRPHPWGFLVDPKQAQGNIVGGVGINFPRGLGFNATGVLPVSPDPVFKGVGSLGVNQQFGDLNIGASIGTPLLRDYYTKELMLDPELSLSGRYNIPYKDKRNTSGLRLREGGYMDAELSDEEIQELRDGGYILEEMDEGGEPGPGDPPTYEEQMKVYKEQLAQYKKDYDRYKRNKKYIQSLKDKYDWFPDRRQVFDKKDKRGSYYYKEPDKFIGSFNMNAPVDDKRGGLSKVVGLTVQGDPSTLPGKKVKWATGLVNRRDGKKLIIHRNRDNADYEPTNEEWSEFYDEGSSDIPSSITYIDRPIKPKKPIAPIQEELTFEDIEVKTRSYK